MKAISLCQPWGDWIIYGPKSIETRTHQRFRGLLGQTIAIHSGRLIHEPAWEWARPYWNFHPCVPTHNPGIIGTVYVAEARWLTDADSPAALLPAEGLFGLVLTQRRALPHCVECRGRQGIWTLPPEVEAAVRRQVT